MTPVSVVTSKELLTCSSSVVWQLVRPMRSSPRWKSSHETRLSSELRSLTSFFKFLSFGVDKTKYIGFIGLAKPTHDDDVPFVLIPSAFHSTLLSLVQTLFIISKKGLDHVWCLTNTTMTTTINNRQRVILSRTNMERTISHRNERVTPFSKGGSTRKKPHSCFMTMIYNDGTNRL